MKPRMGTRARMRAWIGVLLTATAGLVSRDGLATKDTDARARPHPVYALYAIVPFMPPTRAEDLAALARNFELAQFETLDPGAVEQLHRLHPGFKCVRYMNSTHTHGADRTHAFEDLHAAEATYRRAIAMCPATRLSRALGAGETEMAVEVAGGELPLKPSTIEGDLSSTDPGRPSTRFYVTWVRIDDEQVRLDAWDPSRGTFRVSRGFAGSTAAPHAEGARVFSPCYLGSENEQGAFPGGHGASLRYSVDVCSPEGWRWKADQVLVIMDQGFDGAWLDILGATAFNVADMNGKKAEPWNFTKSRSLSSDEFRECQERKVHFTQEFVKERTGRYPFLVGNNLKAGFYAEGLGGESLFLMPTGVKPRPVDGMCIEDFTGGYRGGYKIRPEPDWKKNVTMLMAASQAGLAAYPMIGNAGSQSRRLEPDTPWRDRFERLGYASYLLAVEKGGRTRFGIPAFYAKDESPRAERFIKVHEQYFYPIGEPAESRRPNDIDGYRIEGTHTYRRSFSGGVVLVNPSETTDAVVALDAEYVDPHSCARVRAIEMAGQSGRILLKPAATHCHAPP